MRLESVLENCIFRISSIYAFSHSQGHNRPSIDLRSMTALALLSGHGQVPWRCRRSAI